MGRGREKRGKRGKERDMGGGVGRGMVRGEVRGEGRDGGGGEGREKGKGKATAFPTFKYYLSSMTEDKSSSVQN